MPTISSQIYNNDGTQLLGTIYNTDVNAFYLKSDGVYRNDTLELAISNFVGLTQTINGTTPDSGYAVPTPSGNGIVLGMPPTLENVWYAIQGSSNIQIPITKNGKTTLATKGTKNVEDIDINVDIPTYITVASESALPSTAQEGTIAVVEAVAMYSVSVSEFDRISAPTQFYYSIDNGMNWVEITGTGLLTSEATQLKFRITYEGEEIQPSGSISSVQAGISASYSIHDAGYQFADEQSENVTLTQNITDIRCR